MILRSKGLRKDVNKIKQTKENLPLCTDNENENNHTSLGADVTQRTYFICLTIVLFPDSPAPGENIKYIVLLIYGVYYTIFI